MKLAFVKLLKANGLLSAYIVIKSMVYCDIVRDNSLTL